MDGIERLRRLKQKNHDMVVIVITGHGNMDLAVKSLQYDATDFIARKIIHQQGGESSFRSRPGQGAQFQFLIPTGLSPHNDS